MGISEPWVALAETATGHLIVPCGRDAGRATATVSHWQALTEADLPMDAHRRCVGAAVVDPAGLVVTSWGSVPTPGGRSRWSPLMRCRDTAACLACGAPRWPGCWLSPDLEGCAACLPALEVADPRAWPSEPAPPNTLAVVKAPRPLAVPAAMRPKRPSRAPRFGGPRPGRAVPYQRDAG